MTGLGEPSGGGGENLGGKGTDIATTHTTTTRVRWKTGETKMGEKLERRGISRGIRWVT